MTITAFAPKTKEQQLYIEKHKMAVRKNLPLEYKCFDENLDIKMQMFDFGNQLGVMAATRIVTENIGEYRHPDGWWEAFKERFWLHKIWPVKYKTIDIHAIYPRCSLSDPILKIKERANG